MCLSLDMCLDRSCLPETRGAGSEPGRRRRRQGRTLLSAPGRLCGPGGESRTTDPGGRSLPALFPSRPGLVRPWRRA